MAEPGSERDDKTEEPTARRLEKAREEGRVPVSREVASLFALLAATLAFWALGPLVGTNSATTLARWLALTPPAGPAALVEALRDVLLFALPILLLFAVAGIAAAAAQRAIVWKRDALKPDPSRLSLIKGFQRIFSARGLAELVKGVVKLAVAGGVLAIALLPELDALPLVPVAAAGELVRLLDETILRLLAAATAVLAVVAVLDYAWQRHVYLRDMRMSRRELKEEYRETEGDPQVKQKLKALRQERARRRMMADVPKATVVVTNPTHVSVALRYVPGETPAPKVVAKGVDHIALEIRRIAREHGIPLVERPELARSLYRSVEVGQEIPPELYRAVAEIVARVLRLGEGAGPGHEP